VVLCTAIPDPGNSFTGWGGDTAGTGNPLSITVGRPVSITALFDSSFYGLQVAAGWNLVSIPCHPVDPRTNSVFAGASSRLFGYTDRYVSRDSALPGDGYWIKYPAAGTIAIPGSVVTAETIAVSGGWNIVGCPGFDVPVAGIVSEPPGLPVSRFFGYQGRYTVTDTLHPGAGYWVKVTAPGELIIGLSSRRKASAQIRMINTEYPPLPPDAGPFTNQVPTEFRLMPVWPNPFNPETTIRYSVSQSSHVRVDVYDALGRLIATLVDEEREPGEYTYRRIAGAAGELSSGVYFIRMSAGSFTGFQKVLLVR
jgi:hypothetical protein